MNAVCFFEIPVTSYQSIRVLHLKSRNKEIEITALKRLKKNFLGFKSVVENCKLIPLKAHFWN
jgi:hypothetical protein